MRLRLALTAAIGLAACGGGGGSVAPADPEAAVRATFDGYNKAISAEDWGGACDKLAPESIEKLRASFRKLSGKDAPEECPETLEQVFAATDKAGQGAQIREVVRTAKIKQVKVTGDAAVIDWTASVEGEQVPVSQSARRIDGEWKLVDVTD